jgi:MSHA pilin protein MshD
MSMTDATGTGRARGFTLIELLIFIVIVGVGLAGILSVMDTVVKSSADPMVRKQTLAAAQSLLEEIVLKDYANPPEGYSGTSRAQFDDVDDYAGYSTSAGIVDLDGVPVAGLGNYNVSPAVSVQSTVALTGVAAKRITVSVTGPGAVVSLSGYRSSY